MNHHHTGWPRAAAIASKASASIVSKASASAYYTCLLVHAVIAGVAIGVQLEEQAGVVQAQGAAIEATLAQRRGDAVQGQRVVDHLQWVQGYNVSSRWKEKRRCGAG